MSDHESAVLSRAEQLLKGRLDAITELERASNELAAARAAVSSAEKEVAAATAAAQEVGWTPNELRQLGLPVPSTRRATGNRGRRRTVTPAPPATN